ncbi:MAG: hypothetical protein JWN68_1183 [Nocardioides sp.]|jgi:hypothetical protein|uniref:hypothetical protein n=1 Tax=Nocardioides sp. TaxID=35761 RepID=UPI002606FE23|nr:hypothetical protein [Nocardioides sp.]MCW2833230.1 hypothetical protein [Nocardioides sp.]
MQISQRLTRWVASAFPEECRDRVLAELCDLPSDAIGGQDPERVQASLVIRAAGDWDGFQRASELARTDWRDALVFAGLGDADWPSRLDEVLGPAT